MGWENAHEWRVGNNFAEIAAYWTVQLWLRPRKTMNTLIQHNRGLIQCRNKGKGKGRIVPEHATKVYRRSSGTDPPILNLGTKSR
jgi:hypothetical protein